MKLYGMTINGTNQYFKTEHDRNYAWNLISLHDFPAANSATFFEIEIR